jgi:hypothetical protein
METISRRRQPASRLERVLAGVLAGRPRRCPGKFRVDLGHSFEVHVTLVRAAASSRQTPG